jgi:hypothetical protein
MFEKCYVLHTGLAQRWQGLGNGVNSRPAMQDEAPVDFQVYPDMTKDPRPAHRYGAAIDGGGYTLPFRAPGGPGMNHARHEPIVAGVNAGKKRQLDSEMFPVYMAKEPPAIEAVGAARAGYPRLADVLKSPVHQSPREGKRDRV